ncbi:MAG: cysteine synthase A [Bacilli bacterium]|jgi:cysteine synthase A|nr:cysteine synthase A [Bacilli bacterium]
MNIKENALEAIGNTPLIKLSRIRKELSLYGNIYAKLERANPTGSIKDRVAKEMILSALEKKRIDRDTLIIEPTSGNTGIGLASVTASLGMKLVIFMPENCSKERVMMMKAFGARVMLTPAKEGMQGAVKEAKKLSAANPGSFIPDQFGNPDNSFAHYRTTGPEIFDALDGRIDFFVASFGTGGTLTGTSRYLKEKNPDILCYGLEPASSPLLTKGKTGPHKIQGIGANFKPDVLELKYVDKVLDITDEDSYEYTRKLARLEGLFCGISSGCNLFGACTIAGKKENEGKNIVTVLPDDGERYLSVEGLYD